MYSSPQCLEWKCGEAILLPVPPTSPPLPTPTPAPASPASPPHPASAPAAPETAVLSAKEKV